MASIGDMFTTPQQKAQSAATATQGIDNAEISQEQQYVSGQEQQLRNAISGLPPNPYFAAAGSMSPSGYAVDPKNTTSFSTSAPQVTATPQGQNMFAAQPPANLFAASSRQAQPVARSPQA